jgi:four helix bundle protein
VLALDVIKLVDELPRGRTTDILTSQLTRAATSVASNYRAACRAKSTAHMVSKLGDVEEEADETGFWLEMLVDAQKVAIDRVAKLTREANEILAMTVASIKTLRLRQSKVSNPKSN